jgi:hypothetical protein
LGNNRWQTQAAETGALTRRGQVAGDRLPLGRIMAHSTAPGAGQQEIEIQQERPKQENEWGLETLQHSPHRGMKSGPNLVTCTKIFAYRRRRNPGRKHNRGGCKIEPRCDLRPKKTPSRTRRTGREKRGATTRARAKPRRARGRSGAGKKNPFEWTKTRPSGISGSGGNSWEEQNLWRR